MKLYNNQSSGTAGRCGRSSRCSTSHTSGRARRDRPLEPRRSPGRQEPGPARADARARRRRAPRRVERDPLVPRRRHGVRARRPARAGPRAPVDVLRAVRGGAEHRGRAVLDLDPRAARRARRRAGGEMARRHPRARRDRGSPGGQRVARRRRVLGRRHLRLRVHARRRGGRLRPRAYASTREWIERVAGRPGYIPMEHSRPLRRVDAGSGDDLGRPLRRYVVAHQGYATRFRRARAADVEAAVRRLGRSSSTRSRPSTARTG